VECLEVEKALVQEQGIQVLETQVDLMVLTWEAVRAVGLEHLGTEKAVLLPADRIAEEGLVPAVHQEAAFLSSAD
jgi:hypothetical protein